MEQEASSSLLNQGSSSMAGNLTTQVIDFLVRRSDNDDADQLKNIVTEEQIKYGHDSLYNYPEFLNLFQNNLISVTILDKNQRIIGCASFNDTPQGIRGKHDFKHQNYWQQWMPKACNLIGKNLSPRNSLWMVFFFVSPQFQKDQLIVMQRVFQNIYNYQNQVQYILFLKRGQADRPQVNKMIEPWIKQYFIDIQVIDRQVLKKLIGISSESQFYYSAKSMVVQPLQIRMAKQQDHDDLAQIFNKQSGVLTSQYGQFFIADLIATQNLTRRLTRGGDADGKAIVGQIRDKAIGLMSISTQIDYKLLSSCFELNLYDNLLKQQYMSAIRQRQNQIEIQKQIQQKTQQKLKLEQLKIQQHKCKIIGQRLCLQQYCLDNQMQIKLEIQSLKNNQEQIKNLSQDKMAQMITRWMKDFTLNKPKEIFKQYPQFDQQLQTFILSSSDFFLQTLEFFGLPKNYMYGQGHWKDWAKKILEQRKNAQLRRPTKKKKVVKRRGKQQRKQDQQLRPPSYFDINPFDMAFNKFVSVGPQVRTAFRQQLDKFYKKVVMFFCDQDGCMIDQFTVDLLSIGKKLTAQGMNIPQAITQNMSSMLQAFGGIKYEQKTIQVQQKQNQDRKLGGKNIFNRKDPNQSLKMIDQLLKVTNWKQFSAALNSLKQFDQILCKIGSIKSALLQKQMSQDQTQENSTYIQDNKFNRSDNRYLKDLDGLVIGQLPDHIPASACNAFVIILFCIDQQFQHRSIDFLPYAFSLFPDKDYVILTQPFSVPQSTLLQSFIQVPRKKNSTFQHTLYIFHRDSLLGSSLTVRRSQLIDLTMANHMIQGLVRADQIKKESQQSIKRVDSKMVSFSVFCQQQIVGLFVMSKAVNLDYYISHFSIKDHLVIKQHPRQKHSKIIHAILNPLFSKFTRYILRQIMRLMNKTNLYFQVHQRTLLPSIFQQLIFVKAMNFPKLLKRKWDFQFDQADLQKRVSTKHVVDGQRDPHDQDEAPFSLSFISKKYVSSNKVSNNTRIIVVGASDTGLSFIQSLLMIKDINFTNIILLAPGGLITMHANSEKDLLRPITTNYTLQQLKSLMIDARVTVFDAKMIKLDKKGKRILLDKNAYLSFDILVIAVGLIDTQLQTLGLVSAGLTRSPHYMDKKYIKGVYSIDDPYLYQQFAKGGPKGSNLYLMTRRKKPQTITVYGRTPSMAVFISGLINRGVNPKQITLVIPQPTKQHKTSFSSNQQRLQQQDRMVNDPDMFEDQNIQKMVIEHFKQIGVSIYNGFNYYKIQTVQGSCSQILFRKKADNYQQLQKKIKEKKIEIQLRQQQLGNNKGFDNGDSQDLQNQLQNSPQKQIQQLQQQQWHEINCKSKFLVTSGLVDIDLQIFHIIHQNGLVYNGRLIVKSNFQTTQNQVFACGKICQFSQRYKKNSVGRSLRLDKYNGRQLGVKLSKHILEMLDLSYLTTQNYTVQQLPKLYFPVGLGGCLPGNMIFYNIKKIGWAQHKTVYQRQKQQGLQKREIVINNIQDFKGHYMKFVLDHNDMIQSVSYMGSQQVQVPSLLIFVGLSVKYLNKLTARFQSGLIPNLAQFLSQNWAMMLYHSYFDGFKSRVKQQILMGQSCQRIMIRAGEHAKQGNFITWHFFEQAKSMMPGEISQNIKQWLLTFLQMNQNHLPMYHIPQMRKQIYDSRWKSQS